MKKQEPPEPALEKGLVHFRKHLRNNNFRFDENAINELRNYIMAQKKKEQVFSELASGQRAERDIAIGFRTLAAVSMRIATTEGRKTVNDEDVKKALYEVFCKVWPFCSRRS